MTTSTALHVRDLEQRLSEAEATIAALLSGQIDAVVDAKSNTPVLLGKAQDALREERDRAQRYLDTPDVILLALDTQGRVTLVNRYACSILGWSAAELLGRDFIETCLPFRIRSAVRARFGEILGGDLRALETLVLTRSGEERLVGWRNTLQRDNDGQVIGTFSSGADITERKRVEQELLHRAQLSALSAATGLALSTADSITSGLQQCAEALVIHLNAAVARIWILNERDGVLELQASAGVDTALSGSFARVPFGQSKIGRIARDRKPHLINAVLGDPDVSDQDWARREGLVSFAGHPLMTDGRVVGVMAVFARHALPDSVISALASVADHVALGIDHQRSADALRTAEARMRFAFDAARVGLWDNDYTTGVERWSEQLEAQHGLSPGTFGGTFEAFVERIHPDDRKSVIDTVAKAKREGSDYSTLLRTVWPDGTVHWLSGSGRIFLDQHGEPLRGVGISQDVTERHTLEAQYYQAQKMEAIGRLAGGVAHDFNNLLTVILGFSELLLADRDPNDPGQADIEEIQKAGTRAAGLTRQLLAFSRTQIIEPTQLNLNAVVSGIQPMLDRLIGEDIKVVLGLRPGLAFVKADPGQVEQIVLNLAVNARDAMPKGGTLTIETANVELDEHYAATHLGVTPGPFVALTVSDTGTGMTPQVLERLFEPFFTTKDAGQGTGLGLATVHGIVTRSGGTVNVYSEVGTGTSFKVYFPRDDSDEVIVEAPATAPRPRSGAETVLVVEDAEGLRVLVARVLERQGYTVLVAANGEEAIRIFDDNPAIDVLLTDVVMPGGSGPDLMTELVKRRPALQVIYMSGYTEDAIVHHGVLDPGINFLHKPFTAVTLGRKIREVLDRSATP
jgi:two-component system cell cycle sensor histidine kinase/response regulator CckA